MAETAPLSCKVRCPAIRTATAEERKIIDNQHQDLLRRRVAHRPRSQFGHCRGLTPAGRADAECRRALCGTAAAGTR